MGLKRLVARLAAGLLALFAFAGVIVAGGSLIAANPKWREPSSGITIYVETNGFHTGFILPAQASGVDWYSLFPPAHLADIRYHAKGVTDHVAISWGQRDFFLGTPDWQALRLANIVPSLTGSDATVVHVYHLGRPQPGAYVRAITVTERQYRALAAQIRQGVALPPSGAPQPIPGYGGDDVFYPGRGHYSLTNSCNDWTGRQLRRIGVRTGLWTPTAWSVMRWFPDPRAQQSD